ncbi:MAG: hypothetical protein WBA93_31045 [Microcoleaceae cyanobacterium]
MTILGHCHRWATRSLCRMGNIIPNHKIEFASTIHNSINTYSSFPTFMYYIFSCGMWVIGIQPDMILDVFSHTNIKHLQKYRFWNGSVRVSEAFLEISICSEHIYGRYGYFIEQCGDFSNIF